MPELIIALFGPYIMSLVEQLFKTIMFQTRKGKS